LKAQRDSAIARVSYDGHTVEEFSGGTRAPARRAKATTWRAEVGEPVKPPPIRATIRAPARRVIQGDYMAR
jgi:hypothetical protein